MTTTIMTIMTTAMMTMMVMVVMMHTKYIIQRKHNERPDQIALIVLRYAFACDLENENLDRRRYTAGYNEKNVPNSSCPSE